MPSEAAANLLTIIFWVLGWFMTLAILYLVVRAAVRDGATQALARFTSFPITIVGDKRIPTAKVVRPSPAAKSAADALSRMSGK